MEIIAGALISFFATASLIYFLMWFFGTAPEYDASDGDDFFR